MKEWSFEFQMKLRERDKIWSDWCRTATKEQRRKEKETGEIFNMIYCPLPQRKPRRNPHFGWMVINGLAEIPEDLKELYELGLLDDEMKPTQRPLCHS